MNAADLADHSWIPAGRYPDPAIEVIDPRFERLRLKSARIERIATGCRWNEGPVWFGDARALYWSDIPNNRILRWDEETGAVSAYRKPSGFANGNTRDRQGRLVTCEHGQRRVTRTEFDGSLTVLADRYQGKRLNSPNDVVVKADGSVWFSDPPFGILGDYEGHPANAEVGEHVYRLDPASGALEAVITDIGRPNGLAFSPDERTLYVVECAVSPRLIHACALSDDGRRIIGRKALIDAGTGTPDGLRVDVEGNLWCGWGMGNDREDGVRVFAPDGTPIGHIHLPERCANVCFGGLHRNRLFMAASQSVYALYVNTRGVTGG
jgi:gluconolactonase